MLETIGYVVEISDSLPDVRTKLRNPQDLILLDVCNFSTDEQDPRDGRDFNHFSGFELYREIRKDPRHSRTPVILTDFCGFSETQRKIAAMIERDSSLTIHLSATAEDFISILETTIASLLSK